MIIRKLFKFEAAHIVRNCSTERCKNNIHGHSFKLEVFIHSNKLDRAGMVIDFSLLKPWIGKFIDLFDHTYILWSKEPEGFKDKIKSISDRWIELPFSPSAENLALMFHFWIEKILLNTEFNNGECCVEVKSIRVHETDTGYAETENNEMLVRDMDQYPLCSYHCSTELQEAAFHEILSKITTETPFINHPPKQQI